MNKNKLNMIIAIVGSVLILTIGGLVFNQIHKNYQVNELIIEKCFENFDKLEEVLKKYKKVVVAEQNMGQFAGYLRMKIDGFCPLQFNQVKGQPFVVEELIEAFTKMMEA